MEADGWIVLLLLVFGAVLGLVFAIGRRRNSAVAVRIARELVDVLEPTDRSYTWLGGVMGFHARFDIPGGFRKVEVTCTLLPRHSLLYLPVAFAMGRGDRLHITFHLDERFEGEAHVVSRGAMRSPLMRISGRERLHERQKDGFVLMATDEHLLDGMEGLLVEIRTLGIEGNLRHLAFVPDLSTLYAQVIPAPDVTTRTARLLTGPARRVMLARRG